MAWIYLAASEASLSHWSLGSGQLPIVKMIDMQFPFCFHECGTAHCQRLPYGMTCEHFIREFFHQLTSSMADFPAKTSALQEMELVWLASEADFSLKSSDSHAIFDRDSFSWKTCQLSLIEDLSAFSWSSLRWGIIHDGRLYQPPRLEPRTSEKDGFSWPTPRAFDANVRGRFDKSQRQASCMGSLAKNWWPTPKASDGEKGGPNCIFSDGRPQMPAAAARWATPTARDHKGRNSPARHGEHSPSIDIQVTESGHPGYLSPLFLEAIMGYPIGWTELEDLVTPWFRSKRGGPSSGCSELRK